MLLITTAKRANQTGLKDLLTILPIMQGICFNMRKIFILLITSSTGLNIYMGTFTPWKWNPEAL